MVEWTTKTQDRTNDVRGLCLISRGQRVASPGGLTRDSEGIITKETGRWGIE